MQQDENKNDASLTLSQLLIPLILALSIDKIRKGWTTYKQVYDGELKVSGAENFKEGVQILEYKTADNAALDEKITDHEFQHEALFGRLVVSSHECKPFDYYLQNIRYPENAGFVFIESVDPKGSKYLNEALPKHN